MMFPEFAQRCGAVFRMASRNLDGQAAASSVASRDNAAAQISQLLELAASLSVRNGVNRAMFIAGCNEYYDNASDELLVRN